MARTTISIPDDVKKRMDSATEPVNWSAVAAKAFEIKLGELASRRKEKTMDGMIERLRASKIAGASALEKKGYEYGKKWAKGRAEFNELERLATASEEDLFGGLDEPGAYALNIAFVIGGFDRDNSDNAEVWEFWDHAVGNSKDERLNSEDFLRGFVVGADAAYKEVADKI